MYCMYCLYRLTLISYIQARLDLGKLTPHVTFLNNLEKDAMYRQFGSNLAELLQTYPGR